jgi:hypothetical protein
MTAEQEFGELVERLWDDELERLDIDGLTPNQLDNLVHTLTARRLVEHLRTPGVSPGVLQCALRFLKDNDISSLPVPGSPAEMLRKKLEEHLPFPRITGTED